MPCAATVSANINARNRCAIATLQKKIITYRHTCIHINKYFNKQQNINFIDRRDLNAKPRTLGTTRVATRLALDVDITGYDCTAAPFEGHAIADCTGKLCVVRARRFSASTIAMSQKNKTKKTFQHKILESQAPLTSRACPRRPTARTLCNLSAASASRSRARSSESNSAI